ncbi:MAG: GumC family protein [Candidatus Poribacteria bacterium]
MQQFNLKQMTLLDLWQIFRRRMWIIILPLVAVVIVAVPGSFLLTPEYQASATLISKEVDEGSILEGLGAIRLRPQEKIQLIVQKIKSRKYMMDVADQMNIKEYLERKRKRPATTYDIMGYLNSLVTIKHKGGDMVEIIANHEDPDMAMNIANTVANVYVNNALQRRQKAVSSSFTFLNSQLDEFRKRLREAEQKLLDEQKKGVLQSLDQENVALLAQITKLDADLIDKDMELQQAQEQLQQAEDRLRNSPGRALPFTNPELLRLKTELAGLKTQMTELQKTYSDEWPEVKKLQLEIAQKEAEISKAEGKISPITQKNTSMEVEYWRDKVKTLTIQKSTLTNKINEYNRKLQQLPQRQLDMARLQREKASIENIYSMLLERRNNAMILEATEKEDMGHVAEIQDPAIRPNKPIKPNKKKIAVMAVALGLMLGGGAAFLLEFFDHSFYSLDEVEEYLSLPVLGAIHRINTYEGEIRARRKKRLKFAFAGLSGMIILLLIIDLINFRFFTHDSQFFTIAKRMLLLMKQAANAV